MRTGPEEKARSDKAWTPEQWLPDLFSYLGRRGDVVHTYQPGARAVALVGRKSRAILGDMAETGTPGLFTGTIQSDEPYFLRINWERAEQETEDPYGFGFALGDLDLHLFGEGAHQQGAKAHPICQHEAYRTGLLLGPARFAR